MHSLFGVSSAASQQQPGSGHDFLGSAASSPLCLTVDVNGCELQVPLSVVSSTAFHQTVLGRFMTSAQKTHDFGDGFTMQKLDQYTVSIMYSGADSGAPGSSPPAVVGDVLKGIELWIRHVIGHRPLEKAPFRTLVKRHAQLCEAHKRFVPNSGALPPMPFRLWTARRWSDLTGVYGLKSTDAALLHMEAVAVQLPDKTVQGIRRLHCVNVEDHRQNIEDMLTSPKEEWSRILAAYEFMGCYVVLLEAEEITAEEKENTGEEVATVTSFTGTGSPASPTSVVCHTSGEKLVQSVLIKLPHTENVAAFDLTMEKAFRAPSGLCDFPAFYRRSDRLLFLLSKSLSLEVAEIVDETSGMTKLRMTPTLRQSVELPGGSATDMAAAAVMSLFKERKVKREWQCFHPELPVRYDGNAKWIKELGDVSRVKMFSWGALLVLRKPDSPFAMLCIDHPELRALYGERISICLRGAPPGLTREEIDVTVTPGLERVYLCCFGQIASAAVVPLQPRIDFGISDTGNRQYRLRLAHTDVPEGAPIGANFRFLHSVGMLLEFRTDSGMYYQNSLCKELCPRYTASSKKTLTTVAVSSAAVAASSSSAKHTDMSSGASLDSPRGGQGSGGMAALLETPATAETMTNCWEDVE